MNDSNPLFYTFLVLYLYFVFLESLMISIRYFAGAVTYDTTGLKKQSLCNLKSEVYRVSY